jgi:GMP synthase (glutamine-hydrolysing)
MTPPATVRRRDEGDVMRPVVILQHEPDDPPGSIAVALRELGVPFETRRLDQGDPLPVWPDETSGIISMGGAMHVTQTREYPFLVDEKRLLRRVHHQGGPVWAICLGAQLLTEAVGGSVYRRDHPEVGWVEIQKVADDPLLRGVTSPFVAFNWHEYSCTLPSTAHAVAERDDGLQVFRAGGCSWATQFHPEVDAEMAPHWVRDAVKEHPKLGPEFAERLRADTERYLPAYPDFCRRLTENFVRFSALLPAEA